MKEKQKQKQKKGKKNKRDKNYSERVRAKWFCCAFKSGFLQLICKASSLALPVILKERNLYESKHVAVECRCLKYETSYPFW